MSAGLLLTALPVLACAVCLLLMCRPGSRACHTDTTRQKAELREEIDVLRARLAARDTERTRRS